jgi:hypothetical protein
MNKLIRDKARTVISTKSCVRRVSASRRRQLKSAIMVTAAKAARTNFAASIMNVDLSIIWSAHIYGSHLTFLSIAPSIPRHSAAMS